MPHLLDNPAYAALTGPHASLAEARGDVRRYPADMSPFLGMPAEATAQHWADARTLVGDGGLCGVVRAEQVSPSGWRVRQVLPAVQMLAEHGTQPPQSRAAGMNRAPDPAPDPALPGALAIRPLGPADVPDMLALTREANPGPFLPNTIAFGNYVGVRNDAGRLVAMAGHRMRAGEWTEISAVATAPTHRGQGLASHLIRALAADIVAAGERPFLHSLATNSGAIRLYESLGFAIRRPLTVTVLEPEA